MLKHEEALAQAEAERTHLEATHAAATNLRDDAQKTLQEKLAKSATEQARAAATTAAAAIAHEQQLAEVREAAEGRARQLEQVELAHSEEVAARATTDAQHEAALARAMEQALVLRCEAVEDALATADASAESAVELVKAEAEAQRLQLLAEAKQQITEKDAELEQAQAVHENNLAEALANASQEAQREQDAAVQALWDRVRAEHMSSKAVWDDTKSSLEAELTQSTTELQVATQAVAEREQALGEVQQQLVTAKQNEHWSVHAGADSVEALARVDAISVMEEKLFESGVQLTVQEKELRELRRLLSERQVSEPTHRQNKQKSR